MSSVEYHVVETSDVSDEALERAINGEVREGWTFDGMQFAMREASKRPAMAFLVFTRSVAGADDSDKDGDGGTGSGA